jgi:hypothetical protein
VERHGAPFLRERRPESSRGVAGCAACVKLPTSAMRKSCVAWR